MFCSQKYAPSYFWDYDWIEKLCFALTSAKRGRSCQSKVFADLVEDPYSIPRMHIVAHNHLCLFSGDPEPSSSLCGHQYIAAVYVLMKEKIKIKINKLSGNSNKNAFLYIFSIYNCIMLFDENIKTWKKKIEGCPGMPACQQHLCKRRMVWLSVHKQA